MDFDVPEVIADQSRLIQVFVNLIGNARKFTEHGSIKVHIKRYGKSKIECNMVDTGIGIADEAKPKIFKKFYQAPRKELKQAARSRNGTRARHIKRHSQAPRGQDGI